MVQMTWKESRDLIKAFSDDFSRFGLKTGHYRLSYMMSIGSTS